MGSVSGAAGRWAACPGRRWARLAELCAGWRAAPPHAQVEAVLAPERAFHPCQLGFRLHLALPRCLRTWRRSWPAHSARGTAHLSPHEPHAGRSWRCVRAQVEAELAAERAAAAKEAEAARAAIAAKEVELAQLEEARKAAVSLEGVLLAWGQGGGAGAAGGGAQGSGASAGLLCTPLHRLAALSASRGAVPLTGTTARLHLRLVESGGAAVGGTLSMLRVRSSSLPLWGGASVAAGGRGGAAAARGRGARAGAEAQGAAGAPGGGAQGAGKVSSAHRRRRRDRLHVCLWASLLSCFVRVVARA